MSRGVVLAVAEGKLDFGTRVQIFYKEFDGRGRAPVLLQIIGE